MSIDQSNCSSLKNCLKKISAFKKNLIEKFEINLDVNDSKILENIESFSFLTCIVSATITNIAKD
jgi:hypothetical protein